MIKLTAWIALTLAFLLCIRATPIDVSSIPSDERNLSERASAPKVAIDGCDKPSSLPSEAAKTFAPVQVQSLVGSPVPVSLYWNVVHCNGTGMLTLSEIEAQIPILNRAFRDVGNSGFKFTLAGVKYRRSCEHFGASKNSLADLRGRRASRRGGNDALNVWSRGLPTLSDGNVHLGYATWPSDLASKKFATDRPSIWYRGSVIDGVTIDYRTLKGVAGSYTNYNGGKTLVHETGHWFQIYHIFEKGCKSPGDEIDGTPYQKVHAGDWPLNKVADTCPGGKKDLNGNHMDYSFDHQRIAFHPDQFKNMIKYFSYYRRKLA